ncbi:MAG TPA: hypothetical protein VFR88_14435 [Microlunatus sp.]|nr:hypothetical protein [Microlunatus sp.]
MTQPPLGTTPGGPGPFDERGPGYPDVAPSSTDTTLDQNSPYPTATSTTYGEPASTEPDSKVEEAKGEAKQVAGTALDSGKDVAQTAKNEAAHVAAEAKQQAASLFDTVRTEAGEQASTQQQRVAEALHGLAKELDGMAAGSEQSGPLTDLAHQASAKGGEIAHWLQEREPADVLEAVRSFGRRRPVAFLALCGLAGVLAGRVTRSTVANRTSLDSSDGGVSDRELSSNGTARPVVEPVPATYSTGVLGATPETTEAPLYGDDPTRPGTGYTGTTRPVTELNGDLTR